ncbi:MAG: helix-turn-helix domain-containing protein [Synergistaceae bacterium]|nr:helix-turn-helix domain-containing protein [Synergistaceae bacterium]
MYRDIFAKRLKGLRLSRNMTLQSLGDVAGCNRQNVNNLENARVSPSFAMLMTLADFFDVSLDYLVGRSDDPARPSAGGGMETAETEQNLEKKKLIGMIGALHDDDMSKAIVYMAFLRHWRRREDGKKRRAEGTDMERQPV